ncbi:MAG: UDP-N-acetylmuramate--L-alanine ligase [Candidatus Muiribacterium halophilum]|uniref:UDP-N-acetylmuramate--L-alanine ligase n=1 Tax=Muiribacterium halophilum TaxID=2053465 RepID=A0A2N5ZI63_MUIH1|nr:MAG: UDP-N-acetylmuramate--L-alanine ligase [Candidatus Muirbacterium halophilum]
MNLNLDPGKNIHFIGVGGTGMSGLAIILHKMGYKVSGSDLNDNISTRTLKENGIMVYNFHNSGNISGSTQLVVRSAAIPIENPEIFTAKARNIEIIKYSQMLGYIMKLKKGIAVAGTHGKTTTTSMIAFILKQANYYPGFVIGGIVNQLQGSSSAGSGDLFVAEACEYDRSFLNLEPQYAIINNIEEDHLDYYRNLDDIEEAFIDFTKNIREDGILFYFNGCPNTKKVVESVDVKKISYGLEEESNYRCLSIDFNKARETFYKVLTPAKEEIEIRLSLFGLHNIINSLAAFSFCHEIGVPSDVIVKALSEFKGIKRRFEILYNKKFMIVDDYAHHPTEIKTVLKYTRENFKKNRIIVVFQPHQHSRTRFLLDDFATSFSHPDIVIVPDIYFVRDTELEKKMISSKDLVKKIVSKGGNAFYIPSFLEIEKFLDDNIIEDDLIIFMGAGNINEIAYNLVASLEENFEIKQEDKK